MSSTESSGGAGPPHRRAWVIYWRIANPINAMLAGFVPWWVLVETTGWKTGRQRRTPLAAGPKGDDETWLIAVHGRHSAWVRNVIAQPNVRLKHKGRWVEGTASVEVPEAAILAKFNAYARSAIRLVGYEAVLVRVAFTHAKPRSD